MEVISECVYPRKKINVRLNDWSRRLKEIAEEGNLNNGLWIGLVLIVWLILFLTAIAFHVYLLLTLETTATIT